MTRIGRLSGLTLLLGATIALAQEEPARPLLAMLRLQFLQPVNRCFGLGETQAGD